MPSETNNQAETSDDSGTKAPENKEHVQSELRHRGGSLQPGGSHGARVGVGVSELDRDMVPNGATDPGQTRYDKPPLLDRDGSD